MERSAGPRAQNLAVLLPVLGLFLLMPPFVTLFTGQAQVFGVPVVVAYLFGVWAALVLASALLARALRPGGEPEQPTLPPPDGADEA